MNKIIALLLLLSAAASAASYSLVYSDGTNVFQGGGLLNTNQIDGPTWNAATNLPVMASNVRSGRTAVTSLLTSTNITFSSPMASTNYQIFQGTVAGNLAVFGVPSNITTNGFTMNFTVGITSTIGYICILNQ